MVSAFLLELQRRQLKKQKLKIGFVNMFEGCILLCCAELLNQKSRESEKSEFSSLLQLENLHLGQQCAAGVTYAEAHAQRKGAPGTRLSFLGKKDLIRKVV